MRRQGALANKFPVVWKNDEDSDGRIESRVLDKVAVEDA